MNYNNKIPQNAGFMHSAEIKSGSRHTGAVQSIALIIHYYYRFACMYVVSNAVAMVVFGKYIVVSIICVSLLNS